MSATHVVRHWKDNRFNPDAEFVFLKPLHLYDNVFVKAGDVMTEETKERLGKHRLKVWWNGRIIGTKKHIIRKGVAPAAKAPAKGPAKKVG